MRSEGVTSLSIRWNLERTAWNRGCSISLDGITLLNRLAILIKPLNVVAHVIRDRKAFSIGLDRISDRGPVIGGVLIHHIKLQRLRCKRDIPAQVLIIQFVDLGTIATEKLCISAIRVRPGPLPQGPRVEHADIIRQLIAVLVKDLDVGPVHVHVLRTAVAVYKSALITRRSNRVELILRHRTLTIPGLAVNALPI